MHNDGGSVGDNSWTQTPYLPAIIPPNRPLVAVPVWRRFALPHWRLILVAALAGGVGIASATLWPFQTKLSAVGRSVPGHDAASHDAPSHAAAPAAGDSAAHASTTAVDGALSTTVRVTATPSTGIDGDVCRASFPGPQLAVGAPPTMLPAEAPAALGVTVDGAADGANVVICGFAAKSVFSAGHSVDGKTWTMPASYLADATLLPPRGFVGPMQLVVVLVNADKSLADRRALHLQWLPGAVAMPRIAEINEQLEEGKRRKGAGDLAGARAIFLRLAQTDSRAAFLLAETYDPISLLAKNRLLPPDSDLGMARLWYRRALEHGSLEANARLERLSNW